MRSVVRVHLCPLSEKSEKELNSEVKFFLTKGACDTQPKIWGRSSVGRAPALQAGGHEFESRRLHSEETP